MNSLSKYNIDTYAVVVNSLEEFSGITEALWDARVWYAVDPISDSAENEIVVNRQDKNILADAFQSTTQALCVHDWAERHDLRLCIKCRAVEYK